MPCGNAAHMHGVLVRVKRPVRRINDLAGGAVYNLPILVRVGITIRLQLFLEETVHQRHIHRVGLGQDTGGQQVDLRGLVHVQGDPLVVGAGREVGAVDFLAKSEHGLVQMRAVGVADGVRTPQFGEFLGLFGKILFTGQREAAGAGHECSFVGLVIKKTTKRRIRRIQNDRRHRGPWDPDCVDP